MVSRLPLVIVSANPDVSMATTSDSKVVGTSFASGIGSENAALRPVFGTYIKGRPVYATIVADPTIRNGSKRQAKFTA